MACLNFNNTYFLDSKLYLICYEGIIFKTVSLYLIFARQLHCMLDCSYL